MGLHTQRKQNTRGKGTENSAVEETVKDASLVGRRQNRQTPEMEILKWKIPEISSPACAKLRISVSLSPCPTFAQAARQSRCASIGRGRGEAEGSVEQMTGHHCCYRLDLCRTFQVME